MGRMDKPCVFFVLILGFILFFVVISFKIRYNFLKHKDCVNNKIDI